ncbi:hypothetical protein EYF80_009514 [Xyrichtys novacula]|uniref:Uncharacterized protein n=1 Tax=Xyrichtys novacula TaxID=13765 RepID=A0AAV1GKB2_XYRNO|nr:hypothetical protein EYF80_009514 [Xyrichtys novacula]
MCLEEKDVGCVIICFFSTPLGWILKVALGHCCRRLDASVRLPDCLPACCRGMHLSSCTDAGLQSSGNPQWPGGDDIIPEQLWLTQYSVFYSNHIAMSLPISQPFKSFNYIAATLKQCLL